MFEEGSEEVNGAGWGRERYGRKGFIFEDFS